MLPYRHNTNRSLEDFDNVQVLEDEWDNLKTVPWKKTNKWTITNIM